MNKCFLDSNIWLYAFIKTETKSAQARQVIQAMDKICISVQVINETCYNLIKKAKFNETKITGLIDDFYDQFEVVNYSQSSLNLAAKIRNENNISFWDSHIMASAYLSECDVLYSEDMQDGFIFENKLKVINPLLK